MSRILPVVALAGAFACTPGWAMFKCTGPDGRASFQDAPCAQGSTGQRIEVRPSPGPARSASEPQKAPGGDLATQVEESRKRRRAIEIETGQLPSVDAQLGELKATCDREIAELQQRSAYANNNQAGATWRVSLATEMQAVASRCDSKQRELMSRRQDLQRECAEAGGCRR